MITNLLERAPPGLRQFLTYAVCGGMGVALDFGVYTLLVQAGLFYQIANVISYGCGTLLSFALNRAITFRVMDAPLRRLATFFAVAGAGYALSSLSLYAMVELLHLGKLVAKAASIIVVVLTQYTLNARITFKKAAQP
ncbi:MAG TPA: GtrA family protein [Vitreimonas sp.]|nr:GtrA family protein [Vitreimonas sp.]